MDAEGGFGLAPEEAREAKPAAGAGTEASAAEMTEESHESLWASMKTVVVQDCAPSRSVQKQATPLEDSPASSCASSSSTSDSDSNSPRRVVQIQGGDAVDDDDPPLEFQDLFGSGASHGPVGQELVVGLSGLAQDAGSEASALLDVPLPSVEEAQQHLDSIMARRTEIRAISAKYSEVQVTSPEKALTLGPKEVTEEQRLAAVTGELLLATGVSEERILASEVSTTKSTNQASEVLQAKAAAEFKPAARPARASGPSARPDVTDVNSIMQQLGASLRQFKVSGAVPQAVADDKDVGSIVKPNSPTTAAASNGGTSGEGFTIGGRPTATASTPAGDPAPAEALGRPAESGSPKRPLAVDEDKLRASREKEEGLRRELWQSFLAGDDLPVGDDGLPPPELYYDNTPV